MCCKNCLIQEYFSVVKVNLRFVSKGAQNKIETSVCSRSKHARWINRCCSKFCTCSDGFLSFHEPTLFLDFASDERCKRSVFVCFFFQCVHIILRLIFSTHASCVIWVFACACMLERKRYSLASLSICNASTFCVSSPKLVKLLSSRSWSCAQQLMREADALYWSSG